MANFSRGLRETGRHLVLADEARRQIFRIRMHGSMHGLTIMGIHVGGHGIHLLGRIYRRLIRVSPAAPGWADDGNTRGDV